MTDGHRLAHLALEAVERKDAEIEAQQQTIREAESVLGEWTGPPDVNAALDYYNGLLDAIKGKTSGVQGVSDLNAALSTVVAGIWMRLEAGQLHAEP